ncbi:hypothetical protein [Macrococcus bovicus]|uniref:Uncharacterized protein n=1 Tax=Macrococcus bovicus TaxID=69968 RepID=A0A4R6C233_9STAP|nr:hypothetical protein [Macrococcus bovicus]TDM15328.1 hypothetical protein ERX55_00010 [Macrococcus bovicus]
MKDKYEDFQDVPAGYPIEYNHFLYYLETGREVEFLYDNQIYFISNQGEGRTLWHDGKQISKFFKDNQIFINEVKIDDLSLREIFSDTSLHKIETVF